MGGWNGNILIVLQTASKNDHIFRAKTRADLQTQIQIFLIGIRPDNTEHMIALGWVQEMTGEIDLQRSKGQRSKGQGARSNFYPWL